MTKYDLPPANITFEKLPINYIEGKGALRSQKVLFVGDSLAYQYFRRLEWIAAHSDSVRSIYMMAVGGCPPIPDLHIATDGYCPDWDSVKRYANQEKFNYILLSGNFPIYFAPSNPTFHMTNVTDPTENVARAHESLRALVQSFRDTNADVVLLVSSPHDPRLDPRGTLERTFLHGISVRRHDFPATDLMPVQAPIVSALNKIARQTGAQCLDPLGLICVNGVCSALAKDGEAIFQDDTHLSAHFAEHLSYLDFIFIDDSPKVSASNACSIN